MGSFVQSRMPQEGEIDDDKMIFDKDERECEESKSN